MLYACVRNTSKTSDFHRTMGNNIDMDAYYLFADIHMQDKSDIYIS